MTYGRVSAGNSIESCIEIRRLGPHCHLGIKGTISKESNGCSGDEGDKDGAGSVERNPGMRESRRDARGESERTPQDRQIPR